VETVASGNEAVAILQKQDFDLVLLDLRMPEGDGFEVLRYLQSRGSHPPVIVLTGVDDVSIASECVKLGAADYLTKPYNFHELIDSVERVLTK